MTLGPSSYSLTDANGANWDLGAGPISLLAGAEGFGMPAEQSFTRETAQADGQSYYGGRRPARKLMLPVMVDGSNPALARQFWSGMKPGKPCTLTLFTNVPSGGDVAPTVIKRSMSVRIEPAGDETFDLDPGVLGTEFAVLDFIADDPYWYGPDVIKQFQTAEDFHNFYAPPGSTYVLWLSSGSTVANASFTNPGDVASWPIIRVDGPVTQFSVSAYGSGFSPRVSGTITVPAGYYLEINTDPRKLTARLYAPDTTYVNVFAQLDNVTFYPIPEGQTVPLYITLSGTGSLTVRVPPRYYRAY